MKAQQQVLVAQKMRPVVHDTNKISGYESIQSVLFHYLHLFYINFDVIVHSYLDEP